MKRIQREIGLDERFLHFIFSFIVVLALCSLYWTGCIELSLLLWDCSILFDLIRFVCVFGGIKINWHGQRQGIARFWTPVNLSNKFDLI